MYINSVSANILSSKANEAKSFGFEYEFSPGLNILTGDNSSGKTTVLSCIYYCLGMEQLMGSKGTNALSPALHQALNFDEVLYNVRESSCSLVFTASNNKCYEITRKIVPSDNSSINEIFIFDGENTTSKFVHSHRDHGDQGFYQWLAEVNGLKILNVESSNGSQTKPLYMQNIFSLSFIEQTKGWSDIFSMMPGFGVKEPKQKVVEYSLGLNSLELNIQLDQIKAEKEEVKSEWRRTVKDLDYRAQMSQLYFSHFNRNKPVSEKVIESIYAAKLDNEKKEIRINQLVAAIQKEIHDSDKRVELINLPEYDYNQLVPLNDNIKISLVKFVHERQEILDLYEEESFKLKGLYNSLSCTVKDIQGFQDISKLSIGKDWGKLFTAKCPVCESSVENKQDAQLSEKSIEKSIAFLKSQKSTYEKYIEASELVIKRYVATLQYYDKKISLKRNQLDSVLKDLVSPSSQAVRTEFELQAELKYRLSEVEQFFEFFKNSKFEMKKLSVKYFALDEEEKRIKRLISDDGEKISELKSNFLSLLDTFGYKSNGVKNIIIRDKPPYRLMPVVVIEGQEPQYIRFVSSASDFVRAIWSYYLCLLSMSTSHPGFLIMDEPGQHQMRVDSMKSLISYCSKLDKQIILSISQDRDYDKKDVNISALVKGVEDKRIKMLHIEDNTYCVSPIVNKEQES